MNNKELTKDVRQFKLERTINGKLRIECIECGKLFVPESPDDRQFFIVSGVCLECKGC